MAQGNSSMEMGTSDQVLVARKKSRKTRYAIGFVAMLVAIGVVIALVVVLSGNEGGASPPTPQPIITTEGPIFPTTISTTPPTTTTSTTTEAPTTLPPPPPEIELEDIINGEFSPPFFNGTWVSGSEILFRDYNGHLMLYDVDTDSATTLISNDSQILQQSFRVTSLSPDGNYVVLSYNEVSIYRHSFTARYTAVDLHTGQEIHIVPPGVAPVNATLQNFVWGPTGTSLAFVYENNVFLQYNLTITSPPEQLTTTGLENVVYHGVPDWVYEEEVFGSNNAIWFSSNGAKVAYATFNDTKVRVMKIPHFGVPGSVEYQYTRHREIHYPKSGTTNPTVSVTMRDIANGIDTTFNVPTDLQEPILKTVLFVGSDRIAVMWTNRVQTSLRIDICVEATQAVPATCNAIFTYTESDGWIDNNPLLFNTQGNAFITILPAAVGGVRYKQIVQVTRPVNGAGLWSLANRVNTAHTVGEILLWTDDDDIWYKATGVTDRAEQHVYTVNSSGEVSCFTCNIRRPDGKQCLFNDADISPGSRISVNCGGPDIPQILIYDKNGTLLSVWDDNSRASDLLASHTMPVTIYHTIRGVEAIEADVMIQVPPDYANRTNLPLLVYVYAGPDTSLVTKQWTLDWGTSLVSRYGIAVARIDGRGSGLRGVDNMFAVNRKLGTVEIQDQIAVTRILHQNLQWLDANRTCIWGWSYGGYAASLALARGGDVFRCAIAVAPVVDWRFYDTIYTERYMDTPQNNVAGYTNSSLLKEDVVEAYRNKSYFLVHGTEDDNVHYQHAMLISRLLQRRDVYFHQMSYTDEDHGLGGVRPHLYHALEKFLQENMFSV
ncbi:venom dipeptidyl peptidase 4-like [Maniola hyperantus]|uniref:venom dipeptidyl peptidase 4-like n=1 Tax=Aphantopus hyperantus TaxID=2795564 RepID=UPI001568D3CC|nr:venom dipeptidyl peptidase 4-like [Maniola hyperantus]